MVREDFTVEMLHLNKNWKEMSQVAPRRRVFQAEGQPSAKSPSWDHAGMYKEQQGGPCAGIRVSKQKRGIENEVRGCVQFL